MDRRETQIHGVWTFGEDGVTREVHPTARLGVGTEFIRYFATDYLTESWRRVPMFGRNFINGSMEWIGVPDFLRTDGPTWNSNLLAPHHKWLDSGSTTNSDLG